VKAEHVLPWVLLIAGAYAVYRIMGAATRTQDKVASGIADLWLKMFPLPPSIELLGSVVFPGNLKVPLQQLANEKAVRQDRASGRVYVRYAGYVWELAPQVYGNWPATRVE
jgi:hypothetical protein